MSTQKQTSKGSCLKTILIAALVLVLFSFVVGFGWIAGVIWLLFFRKKLGNEPERQKKMTIVISALSVFSFFFMVYSFVSHPQLKSIAISSDLAGQELDIDQDYVINIECSPENAAPSYFTYNIDGSCAVLSKSNADDSKAILHTVSEGTAVISVSYGEVTSNILEFTIVDADAQKAAQEDDEPTEISPEDVTSDVFDFSDPSAAVPDISKLSVKHGELLSVINTEGTVVVKVKIEASFSNQLTIDQNYFNVADLVKNHGFNTCNELQYWAVADMTNGEESKCISFTLDKDTIDNLYNEHIVENQLGNYVTDLWILPSLLGDAQISTETSASEEQSGAGTAVTEEEPSTEEPAAPDRSTSEPEGSSQPPVSSGSDNGENFNTYDNAEQQQTTATYVLNTSSHKIHYPSCSSVKKIAPHNYSTSSLSLEELKSQGYSTCGICFK